VNEKWQIDSTLRLIGTAQPPPGLERRVISRLEEGQAAAQRGGSTTIHFVSAAAIAASVVFAAAAFAPSLREFALHQDSTAIPAPRGVTHSTGNFGAASAVHLPVSPVQVQPTPVNQGRGRARSDRTLSPGAARMPHGVAVPRHIAVPEKLHPILATAPASSAQSATP
jgi:hypothetical protein